MRTTISESNPYLVSLHPQANFPTHPHDDLYTDGLFDRAKEKAQELYNRGKQAVNDAKDRVNKMVKKTKSDDEKSDGEKSDHNDKPEEESS